jgi:hypothetical protein
MSADSPDDFRQRLFDAQQMNPALRDAYRDELDKLVNQKHTAGTRGAAIVLLVICLGVVAGEIRALILHRGGGVTFYAGAVTMLIACAAAAAWVVRDLLRGKSLRRDTFKLSEMFYGAAGILTVVTLMHGLAKASDPASTFNAFYVFVFLFVCATWAIGNRITAATIETREHLLRIESRLADLAARSGK